MNPTYQIDYKLNAANDEKKVDNPTKIVLNIRCDRCGNRMLKGSECCRELNLKICKCGHPIYKHNFSRGNHSRNKRIWLCGDGAYECYGQFGREGCNPEVWDPIQQEIQFVPNEPDMFGIPGRRVWVDIS